MQGKAQEKKRFISSSLKIKGTNKLIVLMEP